jgi:hypothetical protein
MRATTSAFGPFETCRPTVTVSGEDRKSSVEGQTDAIDVVDDARSRHRMCQMGDR